MMFNPPFVVMTVRETLILWDYIGAAASNLRLKYLIQYRVARGEIGP